jgi:biotin transport system substrate-specific component
MRQSYGIEDNNFQTLIRRYEMPSSFSALIGTSQRSDFLSKALLVLAGTAVLALAAHVKVPFWPVPMTMQTLVVLLIGAAYGPTLAAATLITYLVEGALGLPVFTSGAGALYMVGPTGGYLVGFLAAATAVGFLFSRGYAKSLPATIAIFLLGDVLVFAFGVAWLGNLIGFEKAIAGGLLPFLPAEALKIALATAAVTLVKRAGRKQIDG